MPKGRGLIAGNIERTAVRDAIMTDKNQAPINNTAQLGAAVAKRLAVQLTPQKEMVAADRRAWIEGRLHIRDKQRQIVPLRFNAVQNRVWADWEAFGFKGVRHDIVKFRQGGISTLVLAYFFEEALRVPNTHIAIVSRDAFEVRRKLYTIKLFYERLPDWEKPSLKYNNVSEMRFEGLESTIWVGAAGNRSFGRGDTIHKVLCSELAFWPDAEKLLSGLQEAVPDTGDLIIETTANGAGTFHHGHYQDSRDNPESPWKALFLPWYLHEEYQVFEGPALMPDPAELRAQEKYHLTVPQLRWRRQKKASLKGLFPQEYPETDEEAFLFSGRPRFDRQQLLDIMSTVVREPLETEKNGMLKIYAQPVEGAKYTIGADTAEGVATGDFDSAHVVDDATGIEVAHLHGKWPLHEYADLLGDLGQRYNMAFLAVERNNTGHAVLQRLMLGGEGREPYPRRSLYYHKSFDAKIGSTAEKLGWPTDAVTKPIMTAGLETMILEHPETFIDRTTVAELLSIVYLDDGGVGAPAGAHDDRYVSRAIAEQARKSNARGKGEIRLAGAVSAGKTATKEREWADPRGEIKRVG